MNQEGAKVIDDDTNMKKSKSSKLAKSQFLRKRNIENYMNENKTSKRLNTINKSSHFLSTFDIFEKKIKYLNSVKEKNEKYMHFSDKVLVDQKMMLAIPFVNCSSIEIQSAKFNGKSVDQNIMKGNNISHLKRTTSQKLLRINRGVNSKSKLASELHKIISDSGDEKNENNNVDTCSPFRPKRSLQKPVIKPRSERLATRESILNRSFLQDKSAKKSTCKSRNDLDDEENGNDSVTNLLLRFKRQKRERNNDVNKSTTKLRSNSENEEGGNNLDSNLSFHLKKSSLQNHEIQSELVPKRLTTHESRKDESYRLNRSSQDKSASKSRNDLGDNESGIDFNTNSLLHLERPKRKNNKAVKKFTSKSRNVSCDIESRNNSDTILPFSLERSSLQKPVIKLTRLETYRNESDRLNINSSQDTSAKKFTSKSRSNSGNEESGNNFDANLSFHLERSLQKLEMKPEPGSERLKTRESNKNESDRLNRSSSQDKSAKKSTSKSQSNSDDEESENDSDTNLLLRLERQKCKRNKAVKKSTSKSRSHSGDEESENDSDTNLLLRLHRQKCKRRKLVKKSKSKSRRILIDEDQINLLSRRILSRLKNDASEKRFAIKSIARKRKQLNYIPISLIEETHSFNTHIYKSNMNNMNKANKSLNKSSGEEDMSDF